MSKFSHLHTHTHFSLLEALPKIPTLVKKAKSNGCPSLAITDNGNMYGTIEFYKECKKNEIKPIIGVDFYLAARNIEDKDLEIDIARNRIVLLAKDETGYKNLIKLVTISYLDGFFFKPRIDKKLLKEHKDGLIAILPAMSSETSTPLRSTDLKKAEIIAKNYKEIFGDNLFLEVTRHEELENHDALVQNIIKLGKLTSIQLVASHEVLYINPEDKKALTVVSAIQSVSENEKDGLFDESGDFSFIDTNSFEEIFKDIPEALENNIKIQEMCNLELELGKWMFPDIEVHGESADEELRQIVIEGLIKRSVEETEEVKTRYEYELSVIKMKGYAPYFLVVADLLRFAKENGILSNIRGSVSGSLVTYLSGITNINPLEYQIPFERFLNPERPSAPDIDMDYADNRRDEMVEYARRKYGKNKVAQIGTFGTMMARGAVRDVSRAMGYPYGMGDRIAKLIPFGSQGFPMTIDHALETTPELKEIYDKEEDVKEIIDMAKSIEGNARHISIHAAGIVMSPVPLNEITPVQLDPKESGKIITQYDMYSVEEAGLLKFDFLGLKNLSIIAHAFKLVKKFHDIELTVDSIPLDDKKTFEMLARGETADLFQLNGSGMTRFLMELKPSAIHDINAMVALYRPGPLEFIPDYIARKHDPSKIRYLDPALEPILNKTYGILVYQDDLLMMANQLAGYSWGEVDKFRKAVGKKIPEEMAAQREKFINGCINHSKWSEKKATEVWHWIEPFASYGFNKAHSVSYGKVAYHTAYLKANFPGEYMTAILSAEAGDVEKVAESVKECKRMGIDVLPPDINSCFKDFTLVKEGEKNIIRFGLVSIKNFGEGIANTIINEREKNGKFSSLGDFLARIKDRNLNKKSLEALIYSGALDSFGERGEMMGNIESLLEFNKEQAKGEDQFSLFGNLSGTDHGLTLAKKPKMEMDEKLKWEKELLGLYVSGHPLDKYKAKMEGRVMTTEKIKTQMQEGMIAVATGLIEDIKPMLTKNGEKMLFIKITDYVGSMEIVAFPRVAIKNKDILAVGKCLSIKGKVSKRNNQSSLIAEEAREL